MSKSKKDLAAERRKQGKLSTGRQQQKKRRPIRGKKRNQGWIFIVGTLAVIAIIIGIFLLVAKPTTTSIPAKPSTAVNPTILREVTNVNPKLLSEIGPGKATNNFQPIKGSPRLLTGPTGKPELLYIGAEFCPYCAAERWPLVIALSRFGTFHNLKETTSSPTDLYPSTPTFSFYQSSYTSSYIDFVAVETADQQGRPLQKLTPEQQQIFDTYDAPPYIDAQNKGSIPFLDVGNRYVAIGPNYDPGAIRTNPQNPYSPALPPEKIASQLTSNNTLSQYVLGSANYYTAAICSLTKNQPPSVCNDPAIQRIEQTLPKSAQTSVNSQDTNDSAMTMTTRPIAAIETRRR